MNRRGIVMLSDIPPDYRAEIKEAHRRWLLAWTEASAAEPAAEAEARRKTVDAFEAYTDLFESAIRHLSWPHRILASRGVRKGRKAVRRGRKGKTGPTLLTRFCRSHGTVKGIAGWMVFYWVAFLLLFNPPSLGFWLFVIPWTAFSGTTLVFAWRHQRREARRNRRPSPPQLRATLSSGDVVPVDCEYIGVNTKGTHIWEVTVPSMCTKMDGFVDAGVDFLFRTADEGSPS